MSNDRPIRDYVIPLVEGIRTDKGWELGKFHGTCFLIEDCSVAVTNRHLLGSDDDNELGVLLVNDSGNWDFYPVESEHPHPTEDLAVLKFANALYEELSIFVISPDKEFSTCEYAQWSYPENVTNEVVVGDRAVFRPDLVYIQGYVRRRVQDAAGRYVYELSEMSNIGCSGSPLVKRFSRGGSGEWQVMGIYYEGHKTTYSDYDITVGHAVMSDVVCGWIAQITSATR